MKRRESAATKSLKSSSQPADPSGRVPKQKQPDSMMTKVNTLESMHKEDRVLLTKDMIWQI